MKPILSLALLMVTAIASAGSLTPPGPPAPTMKTLNEVEARTPISASQIPLTITQSGSYYLTENITVTASGTHGIIINAPDVVLDLNGFTLAGPGKDTGGFSDGIRYNHLTTGTITIKNGTVRDWTSDGLDLIGAPNAAVTNLVSSFNHVYGISMASGTISNSTFHNNDLAGAIIFGGTVQNCTFRDNDFGVVTGQGDEFSGLITNNQFTGHSPYSIRVNGGKFRITNNIITGPGTATGIFVGSGQSLVTGNMITNHSNNYDLHVTCTAGPIVPLSGGTIATGHAWANFTD